MEPLCNPRSFLIPAAVKGRMVGHGRCSTWGMKQQAGPVVNLRQTRPRQGTAAVPLTAGEMVTRMPLPSAMRGIRLYSVSGRLPMLAGLTLIAATVRLVYGLEHTPCKAVLGIGARVMMLLPQSPSRRGWMMSKTWAKRPRCLLWRRQTRR